MKVDSKDAPPTGSGPAKEAPDGARFQRALLQGAPPRRPGGVPASPGPAAVRPGALRPLAPTTARGTGPVLATGKAALASPENLGRMRERMHAEASRLGTVRGEDGTRAREHTEQRLTDLIARELSREPRAPPPLPSDARPGALALVPDSGRSPAGTEPPAVEPRTVPVTPGGGVDPGSEPGPAARTEAALELIERIEVFVKSQRPALGLSLRGALEATVEVERTGPREVALRIQGRGGPVPAEELARLRDALEARGLRLRSLRSE